MTPALVAVLLDGHQRVHGDGKDRPAETERGDVDDLLAMSRMGGS